MNTELKLSVNAPALINNLRGAFSNHTTFISELLQNARRAGASRILVAQSMNRLAIYNDGKVIKNFSDLLQIGTSGWDDPEVLKENPFGMGMLSAFYACSHITIHSGKFFLECNTADVLGGKPLSVVESTVCIKGTQVLMNGVDNIARDLLYFLGELVKGFPVPVYFNESTIPLPNPDARPKTGVYLSMDETKRITTSCTKIYLLGFPIASLHDRCEEHYHIVHLDPLKYQARMPDRDTLHDYCNSLSRVKEEVCEKLSKIKVSRIAYHVLQDFGALHMLSNEPKIPVGAVGLVSQLRTVKKCRMEKWVDGEHVIPTPANTYVFGDTYGMKSFMWLYAMKCFSIFPYSIPMDSKCLSGVKKLNDADITITPVNPVFIGEVKGGWDESFFTSRGENSNPNVRINTCDFVSISGLDKEVSVDYCWVESDEKYTNLYLPLRAINDGTWSEGADLLRIFPMEGTEKNALNGDIWNLVKGLVLKPKYYYEVIEMLKGAKEGQSYKITRSGDTYIVE